MSLNSKEINGIENARSHDIWKTVAFSMAQVGRFAMTLVDQNNKEE